MHEAADEFHTSLYNKNANNCVKATDSFNSSSNLKDYYWRDYTGEIPYDAVPGGYDINNKTTYIGQAFFHNEGILVGSIYPGRTEIQVCSADNSAEYSDIGLKILCSPKLNCLTWNEANSSNLHVSQIGKHLVVGGFEYGKMINIGRAYYQGEVVVGKVVSYETENAQLYFAYKDTVISVNTYQILIYSDND